MNAETSARLFGYEHAFAHPVTLWASVALALVLLACPVLILALAQRGAIGAGLKAELLRRYYSWLALVPLLLVPILLGAAWTILGVGALSILCYREFARATGLFREKIISLLVVVSVLCITFAVFDHWYNFFVALTPLSVATIAALTILSDRPTGYIQRVALAVFALVLFGACLGHLGYFANDANYRPILILIILSVELNDVFAYIVGKTLGKRKLAPNTSPNKTVAGSVGALVLTTLLVIVLGHFVFRATAIDTPLRLAGLGLIISFAGQMGDLMISSVKRDLGIKDMGGLLPGHGGLLDRFDSIILVAPAVFHYIGFFLGIGIDQEVRIFSGGSW